MRPINNRIRRVSSRCFACMLKEFSGYCNVPTAPDRFGNHRHTSRHLSLMLGIIKTKGANENHLAGAAFGRVFGGFASQSVRQVNTPWYDFNSKLTPVNTVPYFLKPGSVITVRILQTSRRCTGQRSYTPGVIQNARRFTDALRSSFRDFRDNECAIDGDMGLESTFASL